MPSRRGRRATCRAGSISHIRGVQSGVQHSSLANRSNKMHGTSASAPEAPCPTASGPNASFGHRMRSANEALLAQASNESRSRNGGSACPGWRNAP
jgi:hypothetical protein